MDSTPKRDHGAMSSTDTLLWTIGRDPVLRTTIIAVLVLDQAPRWEDVQERVHALTHILPRFLLARRAGIGIWMGPSDVGGGLRLRS